jgi:hypothetical protein
MHGFHSPLWRITCGIGLWLFSSIRDKFPDYLAAFFTLLLVIFARNAWLESRSGTAAMEGQLATMQDTAIKQLRALITVTDVKQEITRDDNKNISHIKFSPIIQNSGETAARNVRYRLYYSNWNGLDNLDSPPGPPLPWMNVTPKGPLTVPIAPRSEQDSTLSSLGVGSDAIVGMMDRHLTIYLFGDISYRDVYNYCHYTRFCFNIGKKVPNSVREELPIAFCETPAVNCTDDECANRPPC